MIEHTKWAEFPTGGPFVWFRMGWAGVDLFFVISGFVITYSAARLYFASPRFRQLYAMHRLVRIVPLYLLTGVVYVVFVDPTAIHRDGWWLNLLTHRNLYP